MGGNLERYLSLILAVAGAAIRGAFEEHDAIGVQFEAGLRFAGLVNVRVGAQANIYTEANKRLDAVGESPE